MSEKITKTEAEWRAQLTPMQYAVTRQKATERPYANEYDNVFAPGVYKCICCGEELFESDAKFQSHCGWPAFSAPIDAGKVDEETDRTHGMVRVEVLCSKCDAHLGHVFPDGPGPSGLRYCINSASLKLEPKK